MFSLRPFLGLFCALTVSIFGGGVLAGCGASSTATEGNTTETNDASNQEMYATGRVVYPDTTAVPKAYVSTEPYEGAVLADSSGRFQFSEPLPEDEYTFTAEKGDRQGQTVVPVSGDRIQETVWIVVGGGQRSLNAISIDSVRANPGGPGLKRTGN
jgi:hypothetical protein